MLEPERRSATRLIPASASAVFAILSDPTRHSDTEPTDWVREAVDPTPLTHVGQIFAVAMFHTAVGGHYTMHNRVSGFDRDVMIAWQPGQQQPDGTLSLGGWVWQYDLEPAGAATEVRLTYDWSQTPAATRRNLIALPPFGRSYLDTSLAALERAVTGSAADNPV